MSGAPGEIPPGADFVTFPLKTAVLPHYPGVSPRVPTHIPGGPQPPWIRGVGTPRGSAGCLPRANACPRPSMSGRVIGVRRVRWAPSHWVKAERGPPPGPSPYPPTPSSPLFCPSSLTSPPITPFTQSLHPPGSVTPRPTRPASNPDPRPDAGPAPDLPPFRLHSLKSGHGLHRAGDMVSSFGAGGHGSRQQ